MGIRREDNRFRRRVWKTDLSFDAIMRLCVAAQMQASIEHRGGKVPVTMRALLTRIDRKLRGDGQRLKTTRGRATAMLGVHYVLNVKRNQISARNVDPEKLGRDLGVLQTWEAVTP
jgi:hypothetical protein